ncbi:putative nonstructural protein [Eel River basin pequenovirus]|nr:putative nonstructural protein [Eel River basin pequenovirus]
MMLVICTVFDQKADAYLPPFFLPNEQMAQRAFMDSVGDTNHAFCAHPEDYTLHLVGRFDDATAEILNERAVIMTGVEARAANLKLQSARALNLAEESSNG